MSTLHTHNLFQTNIQTNIQINTQKSKKPTSKSLNPTTKQSNQSLANPKQHTNQSKCIYFFYQFNPNLTLIHPPNHLRTILNPLKSTKKPSKQIKNHSKTTKIPQKSLKNLKKQLKTIKKTLKNHQKHHFKPKNHSFNLENHSKNISATHSTHSTLFHLSYFQDSLYPINQTPSTHLFLFVLYFLTLTQHSSSSPSHQNYISLLDFLETPLI